MDSSCFSSRLAIFLPALLLVLGSGSVSSARAQSAGAEAGNSAQIQTVPLVQPPGEGAAPLTVTLQDALARAQKNSADFLAVTSDARSAHEDVVQARAARLPTISGTSQYLGTQGNGTSANGRYVTNDGVHVYRDWGVLHQDLSPGVFMGTAASRASAAEALSKAKMEIAKRGLSVTVTKNYDALVVAERKYATAQMAAEEAQHFYEITQDGERAGQTAHSDVIKAELQYQQQVQAFDEAKLAMEDARLELAVLLFPTLNENFTIVDDLDSAPALPPFADIQTLAAKENPDLRVALESARQADLDVTAAKTAFWPTLVVDLDYGIEANAFALHSRAAAFPDAGVLPNLGYFVTASLNVPVWDWGTLRSKLKQADYKREQAHVEISQTQREVLSNLYTAYNEATVARTGVDRLRDIAENAAESLRLVNLRYQGGESPALEVVDAQNTLITARNAYADALARYRVALASLQTLTGSF
jgi:outer membrane protein